MACDSLEFAEKSGQSLVNLIMQIPRKAICLSAAEFPSHLLSCELAHSTLVDGGCDAAVAEIYEASSWLLPIYNFSHNLLCVVFCWVCEWFYRLGFELVIGEMTKERICIFFMVI